MDEPQADSPINIQRVYKMIEKVRCETELSHKLACHAAYVVVESLSTLVPLSKLTLEDILRTIETPLQAPESLIDDTRDMARLFTIAEEIDSFKNDTQQRSWLLFDDEAIIIGHLNELNCILRDADVAISKRFLHVTEYHIVNCLAEYYQMETRWSIKSILLKIFELLCILSKTAIDVLLVSVLPLELAGDIQNYLARRIIPNNVADCDTDQMDKNVLILAISVFTRLLSIGEQLPVSYFDTIGEKFLTYLIKSVNCEDEDLIVKLVNLIVIYNLQFDERNSSIENKTIEALADETNIKDFTETLLLLFNRGNDPVENYNHNCSTRNSLLKMIIDIYSNDTTSNLFYNNDVGVLIDIVLRQLNDNSLKNDERCDLLKLLKLIISKADKSVFMHKIVEIQKCITCLLGEDETDTASSDMINEITIHLSELKV